MRPLAVAVVVAVSGCGAAEPASRPVAAPGDRVLERYGMRVDLPSGWHGELTRGALRAANVDRRELRRGQPLSAHVVTVELFETDVATYAPAELELFRAVDAVPLLGADDFRPPESGTPLAELQARRLFSLSGRLFILFVGSGSSPVAGEALADVNRLLGGIAVEPGDFYPGTVEPPRFEARPGWHVGDSGPRDVRADGDWLTAWASTIPYRDPWNAMGQETARALPDDGIAIWVLTERNNRFPPTADDAEGSFARRDPPFRLSAFQRHESWEGGVPGSVRYRLLATVRDEFRVDVVVYFGRPDPTAAMLAEAQAMLDGLRLPGWGPWELDGAPD